MNTYKTIDIARIIGIHVNTVRLYEKCGLIPKPETILDKGIMPSEKVLDFPVDCNTLTGSVNL